MKKFRRVISFAVAAIMLISMLPICLVVTVKAANTADTLSDGLMWSLEDYISIGEVGSAVTASNAPFGLYSGGVQFKTTVSTVNNVASIVRTDEMRAFSKSESGIIDITPADGTCSRVYFTAPESSNYMFDVELEKTDMSSLPSGTYINNWTEVGPMTSVDSSFNAFGVTVGVNYTGAAIGNQASNSNGTVFLATGLAFTGKVYLTAGQVIVISINAGDDTNTDETQTTVKKFDVYKAIETHTFDCKVGTRSIDPSAYNNDGVYDDGHFKLGSIYNGKPFKTVYTETVVNGWGNPMAGIDDTYEGFGANTDTVGQGARSGHWAWAFDKVDAQNGITDYHPIFITPQTGGIMDYSPKYGVPAVIMYTAENDGLYLYNSQFKATAAAAGVKLTVSTGTGEYMMSVSEPNFFAESQFTTANSVHDFEGIVELKAGQTILFIAENPTAIVSPEVGVMKLNVTYMSEHECTEFEGADCQTEGTCVLCGETGEKDPDNHVAEPTGYTDLGNGTHRAEYNDCCQTPTTESHDFSSGTCACGARNSVGMDSSEYVAALSAPASWISNGGTGNVDINVWLTGTADEYASGEVVISYDSTLFTFNSASPSGVYVSSASSDGKLILMIMGDTKTLGDGFNTVATLSFTANTSANLSSFVLEEAGFSTSNQAEEGSLVVAQKYSDSVISTMCSVTLDSVLEGESSTPGLADYTFTAKIGEQKDYDITAKVNGENVTVNANGNSSWTIPGAEVTGDIVITATVKGTAASPSKEYATLQNGDKVYLILYNRGQDGPLGNAHLTVDLDGNGSSEPVQMIWADKYQAYCYLVISDTALDVADCTFAVVSGDGPELDNSLDVNRTGVLDANDAQLAYNMYNFDYSAFDDDITMEKYLLADANGDMVIDVDDVTAICAECATSE